ncbi:MAG: hypothetical protein Q9201_004902 [Fulgogasparrea decipioides]
MRLFVNRDAIGAEIVRRRSNPKRTGTKMSCMEVFQLGDAATSGRLRQACCAQYNEAEKSHKEDGKASRQAADKDGQVEISRATAARVRKHHGEEGVNRRKQPSSPPSHSLRARGREDLFVQEHEVANRELETHDRPSHITSTLHLLLPSSAALHNLILFHISWIRTTFPGPTSILLYVYG